MARSQGRRGVVGEFFAGVGMLARGFAVWREAPRLMLLGLVPALIVALVFVAGFVALGLNLETIAAAVTPFAESFDEPWRTGTRVVAGLSFLAVAVFFVLATFTAITVTVGQPFYEKIWRHVETTAGGAPAAATSGFWHDLRRGIGDGLRMLLPGIAVGIGIFLLGFIPVAGTVSAAILGAILGGWFLTVELTGFAFDARGMSLHERRLALRSRRAMVLGFGAATYLLFLIPLGAVVVMPAAVAGATLLSRRVLEPIVTPEPAAKSTGRRQRRLTRRQRAR